MARRMTAFVALILLLAAALWYNQAPPRSPEAFGQRGADTARALRSQARAAALWVRAVNDGQVTREAATVAIEDAESDARATTSEFAGWDPPAGEDRLRNDLDAAGRDLVETLGLMRITIRRARWEALPSAAGGLGPLTDRLNTLVTVLQRSATT